MPPDSTPEEARSLLATRELLTRSNAGDVAAREDLFARFAPILRRFLHARLPAHVRGLCETDDLVQEVCAQALARLDQFQYRGPGTFWCYLRRIGLNHVSLVTRRHSVPTDEVATRGELPGNGTPDLDPVRALLQKERFDAFESALEIIPLEHRQAVLMRLELRLPYDVIAAECGYPSPDAARMAICRAIEKLVEKLAGGGFHEA